MSLHENNVPDSAASSNDSASCSPDAAPDEKSREETKREKMFDPIQRWNAIQDMITWAERNMPPHFRRNRPRTHPANQK
jgi:hypothetical protein